MPLSGINGNGNGNSWLHWVNTVLMLAVGSLLALYIQSNDRRITKLEDAVAKQERVVKLEADVSTLDREQARVKASLATLTEEVDRLRTYHEHR